MSHLPNGVGQVPDFPFCDAIAERTQDVYDTGRAETHHLASEIEAYANIWNQLVVVVRDDELFFHDSPLKDLTQVREQEAPKDPLLIVQ